MAPSDIVPYVWLATGGYAAISIGYAAWRGATDPDNRAIAWRKAKLVGTICGLCGLIGSMLAFDKALREFNADAEKYVLLEFVDLKFRTARAAAVACSRQADVGSKNECFDFSNIDGQVSVAHILNGVTFQPITNWQNNPALDEIIKVTDLAPGMPSFITRLRSGYGPWRTGLRTRQA